MSNADAEMDTSGARFVPKVDLTHDNTNPQMSDITLPLPARTFLPFEQFSIGYALTSRRRPRARCSRSSTDTKSNRIEPLATTNPRSVPAVLGPQETVQLVTQQAREAPHDQREAARRALVPQQGGFLAATHRYEAAARQNLVNTLARHSEVDKYNVQMQVRQLEQEADTRYSHRQRELLSRFSQEAKQSLEHQRDNLVTEVIPEARRRDEQVYGLRTELSLQALHREDATQHQSQEYAGLRQHLTGLVQETQQCRELFEESRAVNSATGPEIERLRSREAELLLREVRQQNNARASFDALF